MFDPPHKHSIVLYRSYEEHPSIIKWCTKQFDEINNKDKFRWYYGAGYTFINILFWNNDDATLFKLTWL